MTDGTTERWQLFKHSNAPPQTQDCKAVYPPGAGNGIEIKGGHVGCLDDAEFLNDTAIDLYIR